MIVVLSNIEKKPHDSNGYLVSVSFGNALPTRYLAWLDDSDPGAKCCTIESELFMELSSLAHKQFGDCTVYQLELMSIIRAFASDDLRLKLPVQLGTTAYCFSKPTPLKVLSNKLRFWFTILKWRLGFG